MVASVWQKSEERTSDFRHSRHSSIAFSFTAVCYLLHTQILLYINLIIGEMAAGSILALVDLGSTIIPPYLRLHPVFQLLYSLRYVFIAYSTGNRRHYSATLLLQTTNNSMGNVRSGPHQPALLELVTPTSPTKLRTIMAELGIPLSSPRLTIT